MTPTSFGAPHVYQRVGIPIDRAAEHEGGEHSPQGQPGDKCRRLPVAMGDGHPKPVAARCTTVGAGHVRLGPGLVNEDQPLRIEIGLRVEPGLTPRPDIGAILLARMASLFLRVIWWRARKRWIVP